MKSMAGSSISVYARNVYDNRRCSSPVNHQVPFTTFSSLWEINLNTTKSWEAITQENEPQPSTIVI